MMRLAIVLCMFVATCFADSSEHHGPATLAACLAKESSTTGHEAVTADKEKIHTCIKACFPARTPSLQAQCFQTAKANAKTEFSANKAAFQAAHAKFDTCIAAAPASGCTQAPQPKSTSEHHQHDASTGQYNASSHRDQMMCAFHALGAMAFQKHEHTSQSSAAHDAAHACVLACLPADEQAKIKAKEAAEAASTSSDHKGGEGHHGGHGKRRHRMGCEHEFCTKDQLKSCGDSAGFPALFKSVKSDMDAHFASDFESTCSCLKPGVAATAPDYIKSLSCSALPSADVCTQLFADAKKRMDAKKAASG